MRGTWFWEIEELSVSNIATSLMKAELTRPICHCGIEGCSNDTNIKRDITLAQASHMFEMGERRHAREPPL